MKKCLGVDLSPVPLDPSLRDRVLVLRFLEIEGTFSEDIREVVEDESVRVRERERDWERERGGVGGRMSDG